MADVNSPAPHPSWTPVDEHLDAPQQVGVPVGSGSNGTDSRRHRGLRRRRPMVFVALDDGAQMLQSYTRAVLLGGVLLVLPFLVVGAVAGFIAADRLDATGSILPSFPGQVGFDGSETAVYAIATVVMSLTATVLGVFGGTVLIGDRFHHEVTLGWALRRTAAHAPRAALVWLLTHWWYVLLAWWTFATDDDGVGGRVFLTMFVASFLTLVTLFVAPVIVAEDASVGASITRSWRLVRTRFGLAYSFVVCCAVLGVLLSSGMAALPFLVIQFGVEVPGLALAAQVLATVGAVLAMIITATATAQLYLLVRVDVEALDVTIDAAEAFSRVTTP